MSARTHLALLLSMFAGMGALSGCGADATSEVALEADTMEAEFNTAGAPTRTLLVPSITCEGCAAGVCDVLEGAPGVVDVKVDAVTKIATVAIDESTFDADAAIQNLADASFDGAELRVEDEPADAATEAVESAVENAG